MRMNKFEKLLALISLAASFSANVAHAHVSEQGIVLLLPTNFYIMSGCLAVIASMLLVSFLPHERVFRLFEPASIRYLNFGSINWGEAARNVTSLVSLGLLLFLIILGAIGARDPLANLLPLTIWTFFWIAIFLVHGIVGDLWRWINPWTGFYNLFFKGSQPWFTLPKSLGVGPGVILYLAFYLFVIADLAPDDPARLSNVVLSYLIFNFLGMIIFGKKAWLEQVECFSILFRFLSNLSPIQIGEKGQGWKFGLPGWKLIQGGKITITQALFLLTVLASGSFDGVNETFWWLAKIGINPLAFPGRSAVVWQSTFGMIAANILLYILFAVCVWLGLRLAKPSSSSSFVAMFCALSLSLLPIAFVYHASHYLTSFMIGSQYLIAALSDPLANGSNYLGLENYQVTTGYLNDMRSVRHIWLSQAGMVVFGHILAVLMAHHVIAKTYPTRKQAILFHIPVAIFMAGYTWFGLWLLAAAKGA